MLKKISIVFTCALMSAILPAFATNLSGSASVSITSDTAANAKNIAFDEARRQIITDVLRQYADVPTLRDAVKNSKSADLANLIAQSSITGEKTSDTMYSATISMTLNANMAYDWLKTNNVNNWLPDGTVVDNFIVNVNMRQPLLDWIQLNKIARDVGIDLGTNMLSGNTAQLSIPKSKRGDFTIALRDSGWKYANDDGNLRIWK